MPPFSRGRATVEVHLDPEELARSLREDARRGLGSAPKALPPKWFYDERGSVLFERITQLPEYYPTRREREIPEARPRGPAGGGLQRQRGGDGPVQPKRAARAQPRAGRRLRPRPLLPPRPVGAGTGVDRDAPAGLGGPHRAPPRRRPRRRVRGGGGAAHRDQRQVPQDGRGGGAGRGRARGPGVVDGLTRRP